MNYSKRSELFRKLRTKHAEFLASVLWKLTGAQKQSKQYQLANVTEGLFAVFPLRK